MKTPYRLWMTFLVVALLTAGLPAAIGVQAAGSGAFPAGIQQETPAPGTPLPTVPGDEGIIPETGEGAATDNAAVGNWLLWIVIAVVLVLMLVFIANRGGRLGRHPDNHDL